MSIYIYTYTYTHVYLHIDIHISKYIERYVWTVIVISWQLLCGVRHDRTGSCHIAYHVRTLCICMLASSPHFCFNLWKCRPNMGVWREFDDPLGPTQAHLVQCEIVQVVACTTENTRNISQWKLTTKAIKLIQFEAIWYGFVSKWGQRKCQLRVYHNCLYSIGLGIRVLLRIEVIGILSFQLSLVSSGHVPNCFRFFAVLSFKLTVLDRYAQDVYVYIYICTYIYICILFV